jgi:hypothetical protein
MGVTHVLVHEAAYVDAEGVATSSVLRDAGAVELHRENFDVLFRLTR